MKVILFLLFSFFSLFHFFSFFLFYPFFSKLRAVKVARYVVTITYKVGRRNGNADTLSLMFKLESKSGQEEEGVAEGPPHLPTFPKESRSVLLF